MIVTPALIVLMLLIAFTLNGDRYGVVATVIGSLTGTIVLCARFFGWAARHPGGSFHGFLTAFRLTSPSGSSPGYLLGWLLVLIAFTALSLTLIRFVRLPKAGLGYLVAWIAGLGVLLLEVTIAASMFPAVQFFLKFYSVDRTALLLPKDDASFQVLVHTVLPLACNLIVREVFTNHLMWVGLLLYLSPLLVWPLGLAHPEGGQARPLYPRQYVPPLVLVLLGIFVLQPWH